MNPLADSQLRRQRLCAAFSLVDCLVALVLFVSGFSALYAACAQCIGILREARDLNGAQLILQDRVERLRTLTWSELTDSVYLRTNVVAAPPATSPLAGRITETITVNTVPTAATPAIQLNRQPTGPATTVATNPAIAAGDLAQVQLTLTWNSARGARGRTLSTTLLISRDDL